MRLLSLNTWGGRAGREKLLAFFDTYRETDIFCLQEIWSAPYDHLDGASAGGRKIDHSEVMTSGLQEISATLSDHVAFFAPHHLDHYGLLMLVRKDIEILDQGEVYVYREKGYIPSGDVGNHARNIQYMTIARGGKPVTIINFHGLWNGQGKGDSPDRLMQSEKIIAFIKTLTTPVIFTGDFNLNPDTESLKKIEESGLRNLIREYGVTTTRSSFYTKPEKFADYCFISPEITVQNFRVLPEEVSDHLALALDFA